MNNEEEFELTVPISKMFFGAIDGDTEADRKDFENLFYDNLNVFEDMMRPEKFIISGRKGTGKTFLANYIVKNMESSGNYAALFRRDDFKKRKLIDLKYQQLQEMELSLFWKWTFLYQIAELICSNEPNQRFNCFSPVKKIHKFLKRKSINIFFEESKISQTNSSKINAITSKSPRLSSELGFSETVSLNPKLYFQIIDELEKLIKEYFSKKSSKGITLIYDDLDEIDEDSIHESGYFKILKNMLESACQLNKSFRKHNEKTKVLVIIRSDILDNIHKYSSNSNKWITEGSKRLYWTGNHGLHDSDHPLMDMVLSKIITTTDDYRNVNKRMLYNNLFKEK